VLDLSGSLGITLDYQQVRRRRGLIVPEVSCPLDICVKVGSRVTLQAAYSSRKMLVPAPGSRNISAGLVAQYRAIRQAPGGARCRLFLACDSRQSSLLCGDEAVYRTIHR